LRLLQRRRHSHAGGHKLSAARNSRTGEGELAGGNHDARPSPGSVLTQARSREGTKVRLPDAPPTNFVPHGISLAPTARRV
jgi:hypothetical protein